MSFCTYFENLLICFVYSGSGLLFQVTLCDFDNFFTASFCCFFSVFLSFVSVILMHFSWNCLSLRVHIIVVIDLCFSFSAGIPGLLVLVVPSFLLSQPPASRGRRLSFLVFSSDGGFFLLNGSFFYSHHRLVHAQVGGLDRREVWCNLLVSLARLLFLELALYELDQSGI